MHRCHLTLGKNPIVAIWQSYDRLISTMGFPILVRWHPFNQGPDVIKVELRSITKISNTQRQIYIILILGATRNSLKSNIFRTKLSFARYYLYRRQQLFWTETFSGLQNSWQIWTSLICRLTAKTDNNLLKSYFIQKRQRHEMLISPSQMVTRSRRRKYKVLHG